MRISFEGHKKWTGKVRVWRRRHTKKVFWETKPAELLLRWCGTPTHHPYVVMVVVLGRVNPLKWALFFPNGISNLFSWPSISNTAWQTGVRRERRLQLSFLPICIPLIPVLLLLLLVLLLILLWLALTQCLKITKNVSVEFSSFWKIWCQMCQFGPTMCRYYHMIWRSCEKEKLMPNMSSKSHEMQEEVFCQIL